MIAPTLVLARQASSGVSSPAIRTQALTTLPPQCTGPGIETSLPRAPTSSRALHVVPMALGGVLLLVVAGLGLRHVLAHPAPPPVATPAIAAAPSLLAAPRPRWRVPFPTRLSWRTPGRSRAAILRSRSTAPVAGTPSRNAP